MPDRLKGRSQAKCSSWSIRLGIWHGATDSTLEKFTVTKHGRGEDPHGVLAPIKKDIL
jgi:hypothetical protein